jgi:beta-glucosidase
MRHLSPILVLLCAMAFIPSAASSRDQEAAVAARVDHILSQMTLEEKIDMLGGENAFFIRAIPRLGVPAQKMADGPAGVRNYGPSTAYAAGIALAATWDIELAGRVGTMIGRDARARGTHYLLGPGANIYRAPMNGRNFEYFGEDPFLAGQTAAAYIKGVQGQGVICTIKHFMGNNSEFDRHRLSSEIDERTMREIYLPAFEAAVKQAHVGAIMSSYNPINGTYSTQHDYLNNQVVKKEWGFDGVIMSDWGATYDGVAAANGGLDLEMPSGRFMNRATLVPALKDGRVSQATIDDKVRRILRKAVEFGFLDREQTDLAIPVYSQEARRVARDSATGSVVLLKNEGPLLPLDKGRTRTIAVFGPTAYPTAPVGGGSGQVRPFSTLSYLEGLSNYLGTGTTVLYNPGLSTRSTWVSTTDFSTAPANGQPGLNLEIFGNATLEGEPVATRIERRIDIAADRGGLGAGTPNGPHSARWIGYFVPKTTGVHTLSVSGAAERRGFRVFVDNKLILDDWDVPRARLDAAPLSLQSGRAVAVKLEYFSSGGRADLNLALVADASIVDPQVAPLAARADTAIVFAGFDPSTESEGADRSFGLPPGQDALVSAVAAANPRTIVVLTAGGNVEMTRWIDRVPALLHAWFAGQEGGTALPAILYGETSPSGKLPVSFERRWEDNPVHDSYYPQQPGVRKVAYSEGVFLGYRYFDKAATRPLFPFGYGLSYTTFAYSDLTISPSITDLKGTVTVSFKIKNTGGREGAEVAQVYVGEPRSAVPRPPKELKGFAKVRLKPGEARTVNIVLDRRAFAYYDVQGRQWKVDPGDFDILVGSSSIKIELKGRLTVRESPGSGNVPR